MAKDFYNSSLRSRDLALLFDQMDVLGLDALETTSAISLPVDNPDYDMRFGRISYGKGDCLLRMIENFITLESFQKGVNNYLSEIKFSNADRVDLWNSL
ncbi:MAG: M1 family peptidase, partial [Calothrix sp. SM1_7_51]|nr:M1 family peptidase [Calothrix sp. SM1_7_51]